MNLIRLLRSRIPSMHAMYMNIYPRLYCTTQTQLTEGEKKLSERLREKFPLATSVQVQDISGGCGAMFEVLVESPEFQGKRTVIQHKMVNEALKEEIKDMHGIRITTSGGKKDS